MSNLTASTARRDLVLEIRAVEKVLTEKFMKRQFDYSEDPFRVNVRRISNTPRNLDTEEMERDGFEDAQEHRFWVTENATRVEMTVRTGVQIHGVPDDFAPTVYSVMVKRSRNGESATLFSLPHSGYYALARHLLDGAV